MRVAQIYDVYYAEEHHATVGVQNSGQKVWTFGQWQDFWVDTDRQKAITEAIDRYPTVVSFVFEGFTIRQRSA